jgi:hypothetical protein
MDPTLEKGRRYVLAVVWAASQKLETFLRKMASGSLINRESFVSRTRIKPFFNFVGVGAYMGGISQHANCSG